MNKIFRMKFRYNDMKKLIFGTAFFMILTGGSSCSVFKPKYGCPANGRAVGAEKILSGEKVPKARKFKS